MDLALVHICFHWGRRLHLRTSRKYNMAKNEFKGSQKPTPTREYKTTFGFSFLLYIFLHQPPTPPPPPPTPCVQLSNTVPMGKAGCHCLSQYTCNICAIYVQYMCNICAIYVQDLCTDQWNVELPRKVYS